MNTEKFIKQKSLNAADGVFCVAQAQSAWRWWALHKADGQIKTAAPLDGAGPFAVVVLSTHNSLMQGPETVFPQSHYPVIPSDPRIFPSAFVSWSPSKILEISVQGRSRTPQSLNALTFHTLLVFNTAWQMLLFSWNLSTTGQTYILFLFLKAGNCSTSWEIQAPAPRHGTKLCFTQWGWYSTLLERQAQTLTSEHPLHTTHVSYLRGWMASTEITGMLAPGSTEHSAFPACR